MIFYTYENKIKEYFKNHPSCSLEYEEFNILIKLLTLDKVSDEYVIKFRENTNNEEKNVILGGVDFYIEEVKSTKKIKTEKNKEKKSIDYENVLKLMKNNKDQFEKVKKNKSIRRNLNSVNYRILESSNSQFYMSSKYIGLSLNNENEEEILSYLLLEPKIESIDPKLKNRITSIITSSYNCSNSSKKQTKGII